MIKIDAFDLKGAYDDFFFAQQNQITQFQSMRDAIQAFSELDKSFSGSEAENVKNYMFEVHTDILDTLMFGLAELEVKLLNLRISFACVDASSSAVLCDTRLESENERTGRNITSGNYYQTQTNSLISSVADLVNLTNPSYDTFFGELTDAKSFVSQTKANLLSFDAEHASDMANINTMLGAVQKACAYIDGSVDMKTYTEQSVCDTDWSKEMMICRGKSYVYISNADPDFEKTIYYMIAMESGLTTLALAAGDDPQAFMDALDMMTSVGGYVKDGVETFEDVESIIAAIRMYQEGIRFIQETNSAGEVVLKAVAKNGKHIRAWDLGTKYMKDVFKTGKLPKKYLEQIANGLVSEDGIKVTKKGFDLVGNPTAESLETVKKLAGSVQDISSYNGAKYGTRLAGEFKAGVKGLTVADWAFYGVDIGFDVYDSFYDERTQSMGKFDGSELAAGVLVDTATFLAPVGAAAAAGAAWGSAVPGIGTIVGAGVGLIIGVCSLPIYGEPPEGLFDKAKRGVDDFLEGAGNFFSKLFW